MEEPKENIIFLETHKREVTNDLKNMSINSIKNIDRICINILFSMGIDTIGKLLQSDTDKLYYSLRTRYGSEFWPLRAALMEMGLLFNSDSEKFNKLGISDEVALVPIDSLGLSNKVKNALHRKVKIYYLGDLLSLDYPSLEKIQTLGEFSLIELKKYIHSLGYSFKDEEPTLNEIKEEYISNGFKLIQEELGLDARTGGALYKNGIFTVQELVDFGERVFKLVGMGNLSAQNLKDAMKANGIHFRKTVVIPPQESQEYAIMPSEQVIDKLKQENTAIKIRIEHKEELSSEYDRLLLEREQLLAREQKLDEEIASKIAMLQDIEQREAGNNNGRR